MKSVFRARCWHFIIFCLCLAPGFANAAVDLVVRGADSPDPVVTLSDVTYTLAVTNAGDTSATGVSLTNFLSSRVSFVSVGTTRGSCSNVANTVLCDWGALDASAGGRVTITARPLAPGLATNVFLAVANEADTNVADNALTLTTTAVNRNTFASADFIQIQDVLAQVAAPYPSTITVSGLTAAVHKVTVTLQNISHNGPDDLDILLVGPNGTPIMLFSDGPVAPPMVDVTVTFDDSASQFIPDTTEVIPGTYKPANYGNVPDVMPAPAPAGPYVAGFTALSVFNRISPNGNWRLFVYDDEPEAGGWVDGWTLTLSTVETMANLAVAVTDSPDPGVPGQTITYAAVVTNRGPAGATGVRLTNQVPAGFELISYSSSRGSCTNAGATVWCDIGPIDVGGSEVVTIETRPLNGGTYTNRTEVWANELDTQTTNNVGLQATTVDPRVDIGIDLASSRTPALLDQPLVYVLSLTNLGPDSATGVRVVDELPPGVVLVNAAPSQGSCTNQSGVVTCNIGTIPSRGRAMVLLTCRPISLGPITNNASITADQADTNGTNNSAQNSNTVEPCADVQISISDTPDPLPLGQTVTYSISLTNRGPNTASNIVVFDPLPIALGILTVDTPNGACTNDGNSVTCVINELAAGERATITITALANALGTIVNSVSVTGQPVDPNTFNNVATASTSVNPAADIAVTKAGESPLVWQGDQVVYDFVVSNRGPSTATAARLHDSLPVGMNFVSATTSIGSCSFQAGVVTCAFGDLLRYGFASVSIVVTATVDGSFTNASVALSNEQDLNPANNTTAVLTRVIPRTVSVAETNAVTLPDVGLAPNYPLEINISGMTAAVQRVRLVLQGFSHTYPDDVDVLLVGPGGQAAVAMSDAGGSAGVTNLDLKLDDLAVAMLPDDGALSGSHYRPADYDVSPNEFPSPAPAGPYATGFDVFTGSDPNGTWSLYVADDSIKDQGFLTRGWRLEIWARDSMADLGVFSAVTPELVAVGSNVVFAVTLTNGGVGAATSVVLTNAYDTNLAFVAAAPTQGSCTNDGVIVRCDFGEIAPGAQASVQFSFTVLNAGSTSNSFGISASSIDFNLTNNHSTVSFVAQNPPVILTQPRHQAVVLGAIANFQVEATGDAPLSYQWFHDEIALPDATNATLTINDVQEEHLGEYYVQITNRVGGVQSIEVQLDTPQAPLLELIADQVVDEDSMLVVPLHISDPNPSETFQFSAVCDDTNLVPATNMTFAVSGTNFALVLVPGTNQFGTNIVTVTVTDSAGLSATRSFALAVQSINDYPYFVVPLVEVVAYEDALIYAPFQVADAETPDSALIIGMRSYDERLQPNNLLGYFGSGTNRFIALRPAEDAYGSGIVEVRVRDEAGVRTTNLFTLIVLPVEDSPTISSIDDLTISEDSQFTVSFNVSDPETEAADLTVSAESSNLSLFANDGFSFTNSGAGGTRTMIGHPLPNQTGDSRITVFVRDAAGMVSSNAFWVTVDPVNDAPVVSEILPVETSMDQTSAAVSFSIGDLESDPDSLTLTAISTNSLLAPVEGIVFGGSGSNRTVQITPGEGQVGWTVLRLEVADPEGAITVRDFEFFVHPTNGAPLIIWHPEDQVVPLGSPAQFRVVAKGPGRLTYRWQHDGMDLPDETNSVLAIAATVGSDRGEYRVTVTNDEGSHISDPARLTVLESTRILTLKRNRETVEVTFPTIAGLRYVVEFQDSLDAAWMALPIAVGSGEIMTVTDSPTPSGSRFYRIRIE